MTDDILKKAKEMAACTKEGEQAKKSSGLKWCTLFKDRNPTLKKIAAKMCDTQRADAKVIDKD